MSEARQLLDAMGSGSVADNRYMTECVNKWDKFVGSIDDKRDRGWSKKTTAMLLENELKHVSSLAEDTLSTNVGTFTKYVFPVLRRVFPNLVANQIVSVQPMTSPVSGVAYFERKYDGRKGSKIPQTAISNNPTDMAYDGAVAAGDNINQNFAKYYSSEFVDYDDVCTDTGTSTSTALTQASTNCRLPAWSPIRAPATSGQRTFYVKAYYRMLDADAASADTNVVATLDQTGATTNLVDDTANTNTVGTFDVTTGNWSINAAGSAGTNSPFTNNTVIYLQYFVNFELVGYTTGAEIPSVSTSIAIQEMRAEKSALKAQWTPEAVDDLQALYDKDLEQEIVTTFANEVALEIDRRIIDDLVTNAQFSATYTYSSTTPGEMETIRLLMTQIGAVSAEIHRATGRAPANFLVVPPGIGSLLDQLSTHGDYASIEQNVQDPSYGLNNSNFGIARIGTLRNKYAVYQDPYMTSTKILVGLKGNSFLDAGYVYAPYVPFDMTPTFYDPRDQTISKGIRTRFATKMLRPEYYGVVTCSGLPTVS